VQLTVGGGACGVAFSVCGARAGALALSLCAADAAICGVKSMAIGLNLCGVDSGVCATRYVWAPCAAYTASCAMDIGFGLDWGVCIVNILPVNPLS